RSRPRRPAAAPGCRCSDVASASSSSGPSRSTGITVPCGTTTLRNHEEASMGHKEIDVRRTIPAPPAAVFAALLDRSGWPAWSGHDAFEPVRPGAAGPYDVGSVGLLRSGRRVMRDQI